MANKPEIPQIISSLDDLRIDVINITINVPGLQQRTIRVKPLSYHDWHMTALEVPEPKPPDKWTIKDGKKVKEGIDLTDADYLQARQEANMERQYRRFLKALLGVEGQFDDLRDMPVEDQVNALKQSAFMGYVLPVLSKLSEVSLEGFANVQTLADTFPDVP